ncbi:hypothetical protein V8C44DRAFT_359581 [Trichoderma aethiopicum]
MSEQMSAPRITASYLDSFVGRVVTIVGTVTQLRGDQATIDADGIVTILLNRDAHLVNGNAAQIIGKVNPDLSIKALSTRDVGSGVAHGARSSSNNNSQYYINEPQHQPHIAMVWPAAEPLQKPSSSPIVESPSSSSSSPSPPAPSPTPSQTTQDWHHHRQRQWLDRIPYDLPPQHSLLLSEPSSSSQATSSSVPSTARGFVLDMPGSYYSRSNSPSAEEQAMFNLAHDFSPPPSHQPPTHNNSGLLSPPPSSFSPIQDPFSPIPSAQPHTSPYEPSPPPFTNISPSTQPATPQQQEHSYHRPASPISLADSQPTLRQGRASSEYSSRGSPIPRPTVMSHIHSHAYAHGRSGSEYGSGSGRESGKSSRRYPRTAEETEAQALSAVVEGIGRMQVNMNLDQAGRWRIARRADAPW